MTIEQPIIDILEQCVINGNHLFLPDFQIDRKLYVKVDKVLQLAGGKWNRKTKGHVFDNDIGHTLDTLILSGEITDIKKELQYFPTPPDIADRLIELARAKAGDKVLEPSAGEGDIATRLVRIGCKVDTCEIHEPFRQILLDRGCRVFTGDFLQYQNVDYYDCIIANPPFTRQQDIDHVNHMIDQRAGQVVSVMSASILFRNNRKTIDFRNRIASLKGQFIELPEGSFKSSGTIVNTCIVVVDTK